MFFATCCRKTASNAPSSKSRYRASPTWKVTRSDSPQRPVKQIAASIRLGKTRAEIDACHSTTEGGRDIACRAADATAEIQYSRRWFEFRGSQFDYRHRRGSGTIATDFSGGMVRDNPDIKMRVAEMTALGQAGVPDDIGPMIAALLSDDNRWGEWPAY